jgi:mannose-6-phosphate isomerase-like protein (cupin superfamily)
MTAIATALTGVETLWFGNTLVAIAIPSATGGDGMCVIEHWLPHGDSPPLHIHRNEDEIFHIISGTLKLVVDGRESWANAGQTVLAPKGLPHSYRVESKDGAHVLTITHGTDFERMIRAAGRPTQARELPASSAPSPETIEMLGRLCAENNIDLVGPPLT